MIKYLILLVTSFYSLNLSSQDNRKVLMDASEESPVAFANILYDAGRNLGTVSNQEGSFLVPTKINKGDTIIISHLGYETHKMTYDEVLESDTIFLEKGSFDLDAIAVIDYRGLLDGVEKNLAINYYMSPTIENYFMRYFVKQNETKSQMIESVVSFEKNKYFAKKDDREYEINILGNCNTLNNKIIDKVEFVPFAYDRLYGYADVKIDFDENYELSQEIISAHHVKISFASTNEAVISTGPFTGYLIVNIDDKAIEEYYFQKKYISGKAKTALQHGFSQEEIYFDNKRTWKKDEKGKYRLQLMEFNGEVKVNNIVSGLEDSYNYNITTQLMNDKSIKPTNKSKNYKKGKALNAYKELNKDLVQETVSTVLLKTTEQINLK